MALSDFYVLFDAMISIDSFSAEDIEMIDEYLFGHIMAIIPCSITPRDEESDIGEQHKTAKTTG